MARLENPNPQPPPTNRTNFHLPIPKFSLGRLLRLAILILIVWAIIWVSKTGMWQIPLFTKVFYHVPEPVRLVSQSNENLPDLILKSKDSLINGKLKISEAELTFLLANSISNVSLGISRPNVAIQNSEIEFSFLIPKRNNALVRLYLIPVLNADQEIDFEVKQTYLGQVTGPNWLIGQPTRILLAQELKPILKVAPKIQQVSTETGNLVLNFKSA